MLKYPGKLVQEDDRHGGLGLSEHADYCSFDLGSAFGWLACP